MNRTSRISTMIYILSQAPNKLFSLQYFMEKFGAAKSSVSEDISIAKNIVEEMNIGRIYTSPGNSGGVLFQSYISDEDAGIFLEGLCAQLREPSRIMAGGFLYTSDIMFDPNIVSTLGEIFFKKFKDSQADYVVTLETKGIPVALMTAKLLNVPLIVIRRESKISEGSTLSINYFSGSSNRIQKMSVSKRAVSAGKKALIIDDFIRAGGSAKGIKDMMLEFDVEIVGVGIVIASKTSEKKKVDEVTHLITLDSVDEENRFVHISPSFSII